MMMIMVNTGYLSHESSQHITTINGYHGYHNAMMVNDG